MSATPAEHAHLLRTLGHPEATPFAEGMESTVYRVGDGLLAKVWKRPADVVVLRDFYAELAGQNLTFGTPEIIDIGRVNDAVVSVERMLPGRTLQRALRDGAISKDTAREIFLTVLRELAGTHAGPATGKLAAMNEPTPFRNRNSWPDALIALIRRRIDAFGSQLEAAIHDFPTKLETLLERISRLPDATRIIHGDICPENVLVDESGRLAALLDWGFLSASGDAAFDASTAAGFFTMYGPDARSDDEILLSRLEPVYGRDLLLLYRAAYAVIGGNAYSPTGGDGHFEWCVEQLCREDVTALLTRPARHR